MIGAAGKARFEYTELCIAAWIRLRSIGTGIAFLIRGRGIRLCVHHEGTVRIPLPVILSAGPAMLGRK